MNLSELSDFEAVWLTLYGEARGEPIEGQIGVANVIRNRHSESGKSYRDICLAANQFSCWNPDDPNFPILNEMANIDFHNSSDNDSMIINQLKCVAEIVITNRIIDNTKGANHYLEINLFKNNPPTWAKQYQVKTTLGHHIFLWGK